MTRPATGRRVDAATGELRFGRAGIEFRRAQRVAERAKAEAERLQRERSTWPQMALVPCVKRHLWSRMTTYRGGSPLCPACGWTRDDIRDHR